MCQDKNNMLLGMSKPLIYVYCNLFHSKFETRGSILEQNYADFLKIIPQYKSLLDR